MTRRGTGPDGRGASPTRWPCTIYYCNILYSIILYVLLYYMVLFYITIFPTRLRATHRYSMF